MALSMKSCGTSSSFIITHCFNIRTRAALFHSTPFLDRRRQSNWGFGGDYRASAKTWRDYEDFDDPSQSKGSSWFRGQDWAKRKRRNRYGSQEPQWGNHKSRGGVRFCFEDDDDVEVIFRFAFGAERSTYWSFIHDDSSQWSSSSYTNNRKGWKWSSRYEDEYEANYDDYNDGLKSNVDSDRLALGLSASGPLKLEDVKIAYRTCALKWHPDRHQGSSKAEAEEKFKLCSAAYQSLCDKLG